MDRGGGRPSGPRPGPGSTEHLAEWKAGHDGELSGDTRDGFARHLDWERALFADRWAVVSWPEEVGGRAASLWEWLIFEEEYYRAGAPAAGHAERHLPARPDRLRVRHARAAGPHPPEDGRRRGPRGARAGRSRTPAATSPRSRPGPAGSTAAGCSTGRRPGPPAAPSAPTCSGSSAPTPSRERHKGLTYLLVPLDTPGVTVRGFGRLDGDEGFAEVFFDEAFVPDDALPGGVVLGEEGAGWSVAMATTSSERGLTLRSPGRFMAAATRLIDLYRSSPGDPLLRDRVIRMWMRAEAYRLQTLQTVTGTVEGRPAGAETSLVKIWWSRARRRPARDRPRPARGRCRGRRPVVEGLAVLAVRPDLRGDERDPAEHRRRALPRAAAPMRFAPTDDQLAFRDAVRDLLAKECPPEVVRAAWPDGEVEGGARPGEGRGRR